MPAQPSEHQCRGEGHDLGDQQRQQQAGGVQPQGRAVGRGHIDDGVHTIDVAEKGQQEPEYLPVLFQVAEGVADAGKALADGMFLHLHKVHLLILAQQGNVLRGVHAAAGHGRDDYLAAELREIPAALILGHGDIDLMAVRNEAGDKLPPEVIESDKMV